MKLDEKRREIVCDGLCGCLSKMVNSRSGQQRVNGKAVKSGDNEILAQSFLGQYGVRKGDENHAQSF